MVVIFEKVIQERTEIHLKYFISIFIYREAQGMEEYVHASDYL